MEQINRVAETKAGIWSIGKRLRRKDGRLQIVTKITEVAELVDSLSCGMPINDGWSYTATVRAATPDEDAKSATEQRIFHLRKELEGLTHGPDDDRLYDEHAAEFQAVANQIAALEAELNRRGGRCS